MQGSTEERTNIELYIVSFLSYNITGYLRYLGTDGIVQDI